MAEWLCRGLQILGDWFDSSSGLCWVTVLYILIKVVPFMKSDLLSSSLKIMQNGSRYRDLILYCPHCSEYPAHAIGEWFVTNFSATNISVQSVGRLGAFLREVYFEIGRSIYSFDPNRIFSDKNVDIMVRNRFGSYEGVDLSYVVDLIIDFARYIVSFFSSDSIVVALHNNHDFSIHHYFPKGQYADHVEYMYYNSEYHHRDFLITTDSNLFDYIRWNTKYSVILEKDFTQQPHYNRGQRSHDTLDGCLSNYCKRNCIKYINIETRYEAVALQKKMMMDIYNIFLQYSLLK